MRFSCYHSIVILTIHIIYCTNYEKIAGDLKKSRYYSSTDKLLAAVDVPIDAVMCRDANCELHTQDIDCFYERIISCIKCAESECIPSKPTQSKFKVIPSWNNYVKEHHFGGGNSIINHARVLFITV